ncbi:MAG: hypothetical protein IPI67_23270 [Myxococcales bacterium]|nr:hypothetical protein [Myxococcales bacterium]
MQQRLMTPRILWAAMLFSTVVFLFIVFTVKNPETNPIPLMPPALGFVALVVAAVSVILPAHQQRNALAQNKLELAEAADPNASSIIPDRDAPKRRVFANAKAAEKAAFMAYQTGLILGCALSESVALFGFVLGFQGHPPQFFLPFFVVSWILFAVRFPTLDRVLVPLEKATGAVLPRSN